MDGEVLKYEDEAFLGSRDCRVQPRLRLQLQLPFHPAVFPPFPLSFPPGRLSLVCVSPSTDRRVRSDWILGPFFLPRPRGAQLPYHRPNRQSPSTPSFPQIAAPGPRARRTRARQRQGTAPPDEQRLLFGVKELSLQSGAFHLSPLLDTALFFYPSNSLVLHR